MTHALRIRQLVVRAPGSPAARQPVLLGPIDLDVEEGEYVVIVGRSGCGKTTLLRAIAGLVTPAEGTIELAGRLVSGPGELAVPPGERGIGMVFQGGALWPHMSAARTLRFVARASGRRLSKGAVSALLERVQLGGFERRRPASLSGGERQRLALARALAVEPKLLLLDEPLGPLDPELRAELAGVLACVHRGPKDSGPDDSTPATTLLHVTHDPAEARGAATRWLRLDAGRIALDAAQELAGSATSNAPASKGSTP